MSGVCRKMGISEQTLYLWAEVPVWLRCLAAFEQARDFQQLSYSVVHRFTVVGFVWKMGRDGSVATIVMEGVREYTEMHSACLLSTNSSDRTDCPALLGNKAALPDRAAIPDRGADARLPTQFPTPPNRAPHLGIGSTGILHLLENLTIHESCGTFRPPRPLGAARYLLGWVSMYNWESDSGICGK